MTKLRDLRVTVIIKDQKLIKDFAQAKSKLSMDGKIHDHNTAFAIYCIGDTTRRVLEEY